MKLPSVQSKTIALNGGLDTESPQVTINSGMVIEAHNVEPNLYGGYSRVQGYAASMGGTEVYDQEWHTIEVDLLERINNNETLFISTDGGTNYTSTGARIIAKSAASGAGKLVITNATGVEIAIGDLLSYYDQSGDANAATTTTTTSLRGENDPTTYSDYELVAAQYWITQVDAVTGTGDVLGVWSIGNSVVAARKKTGSDTIGIYSSNGTGWSEIPQYDVVKFDTGTDTEIRFDLIESATLTTLTNLTVSGTATVKAAIKTVVTGSNVIEGYLIVDIASGTFNDNDLLRINIDGAIAALGTENEDSFAVQLDIPAITYTTTNYSTGTERVVEFHLTGAQTGIVIADFPYLKGGILFFNDGTSSPPSAMIEEAVPLTDDGTYVTTGFFIIGNPSTKTITSNEVLRAYYPTGNAGGLTGEVEVGTSLNDEFSAVVDYGEQKFQFITHNFEGASGYGETMFFCDKANYAHAWRNGVLVPILTGMTDDKPTHIEAHKKHLFLSFTGGSLQHSSLGDPYTWDVLTGASELAVGNKEIKGIESLIDDVMIVSTERQVLGLYGSSSADWSLKLLAANTGDHSETLAIADMPVLVSQNGITRLDAVQSYGNFSSSTLSRFIDSLLKSNESKAIVAALIVRNKNQYRIYYSDGSGIAMTYDALFGQGQLPQFSTFEYLDSVSCASSVTSAAGIEKTYFGGEDGYVYREFHGYSFNGGVIEWAIRLPHSSLGNPSIRKGFKGFDVEYKVDYTADIRVTHEFDYGATYVDGSKSINTEYSIVGSEGFWNGSLWYEFNWNTPAITYEVAPMSGTGVTVSTLFYGNSAVNQGISISNITYRFLPRRINRG